MALAAGGFTTAALAHIFHRERYELIIRPALLTAMLGYTFVVLGLLADLGRYYNVWHPIVPFMWSGHSVLFEVGMCVMVYLTVLYLEFMPILVERFKGRVNLPGAMARLNGFFEGILRLIDNTVNRVMFVFIILGVVLSCLHQSSLGGLMVLAPYKMHPLWWTPILAPPVPPLRLRGRVPHGDLRVDDRLQGLRPEAGDARPRPRWARSCPSSSSSTWPSSSATCRSGEPRSYLLDGSVRSFMWMAEVGLGVVLPFFMLSTARIRRNPAGLFTAATLVVLGVMFNRINVFLTAYTPVYKQTPVLPQHRGDRGHGGAHGRVDVRVPGVRDHLPHPARGRGGLEA